MSTIVTGEAVTLELPVARLGSRVIAGAIDLAIELVGLFVLLSVIGAAAGSLDAASLAAVLVVVLAGVLLGYPVLMETFNGGRTLGKMAMGLRVVRDDGGPIVARQALVRGLAGLVLEKPGVVGFLGVFTSGMREDAKRIGDLLAGSIVISERIPGNLTPPPGMPPWLIGWAQSADLSGVDDLAALQARQLVGRLAGFTPAARELIAAELARTVLDPVAPPPPLGTPIFDAVCAVLAERRRRELDRLLAQQRSRANGPTGVAVYDRV